LQFRPIGVPLAIVLLVMLLIAVGAPARPTLAFAPPTSLAHRAAKVARRCAACGDIVATCWPINRIARLMRQ
jgi:hypothetical protein